MPRKLAPGCPGNLAPDAPETWPGMPWNLGSESREMRVFEYLFKEKVTFCKLHSDSVRCANASKCAIREI